MINQAQARQVTDALISNMGLVGSSIKNTDTVDPAAIAVKVATEQRAISMLLISMVGYLAKIDGSLKNQIKINEYVYNQQQLAARETSIEQIRQIQPDAVPVAANDNEVEETGKGLGLLASGLIIGAVTLLFTNYKSVVDKLKGMADFLGIGADAANQSAESPKVAPEISPVPAPPPAPKRAKKEKESARQSRSIMPSQQQQRGVTSGGASSGSPAVSTSRPSPTSVGSRGSTAAPAPIVGAPSTGQKKKEGEPATGEVPKNDIVALGKYLQGQGIKVSENPAFGGVGKHSTNSRHYKGQAIDLNIVAGRDADNPQAAAKFDALKPQLEAAGYSVLWRTKDHFDHMHVSVGGPEGGSGAYGDSFSLAGAVEQTMESVGETLKKVMGHLKPTNVMTETLNKAALQRERDLMRKKPSAGQQQGLLNRANDVKPPSPVQASAIRSSDDVVGQYMFMFFGDRPKTSLSNLTQSK